MWYFIFMSDFEHAIQIPSNEKLTAREKLAAFATKWAARYISMKLTQIMPESACGGKIEWEPLPDYSARGVYELEQYANFPEI
jgi:hypothetical protein